MIEDNSLVARVSTAYAPLPGWTVGNIPGTQNYLYRHNAEPHDISLGKSFTYAPDHTTGLARTAGVVPKLAFDPGDWTNELGFWPELLFPTSYAESNANFLVMNCWDKAAITVGFIQLAAHTDEDMLAFFRTLLSDLPAESSQWFPELKVVSGKVCFVSGNRFKSLERAVKPNDGIEASDWYRGDFMQFFNPSRAAIDQEELHASARWVEWSRQSRPMRKLQVSESIVNMRDSLELLHKKLKQDAPGKYPNGVDGMRGDYLSVALAVPHLSPAKVGKAVYALQQPDILKAFEQIEYGPGDREKNVVAGATQRLARLKSLKYDYAAGEPVISPDV